MVRHLIIAALRNMAANRLISAISILGLSVGIAAAILMGLVIHNELTYDHFLPANERTYVLVMKLSGVSIHWWPAVNLWRQHR